MRCPTDASSGDRTRRGRCLLIVGVVVVATALRVAAADNWVHEHAASGDFPLVWEGNTADVVVAPGDFKVVSIAANDLATDIERVTGRRPRVAAEPIRSSENLVIIGTLGHNPLIDALAAEGRIDVGAVRGEWETFLITTVELPAGFVARALSSGASPTAASSEANASVAAAPAGRALVIVGSDRRGTAYGAYELSQAIGVSPWHWWADVAPAPKTELYVAAGTHRFGPPSVQYRGIFINDEDWGIQPWAAKTFAPKDGDIGPKTYAKVFELLLRLKANTLWPAMHHCTRPFNQFAANAPLADDYAIVMGSSHAEPMLRNNVGEWTAPAADYNYLTNRDGVLRYWEERVAANGRYENIYTVGMRGIHDSNMLGPKTDAERIRTLERIFADQRQLLASQVDPAVNHVPQMFCAYKEVLDLYRQGLQVPDDVTIVWPDDNFGYVRNFATAKERKRAGGFGVYYHLSYLGRPLAYLWLNTTPPALIWSEMSKAYDYGAQRIWIANVGDIKPAEIATEFFLQMAWDIQRWRRDNVSDFLRTWAGREFGAALADEIAAIMDGYYRLNFQRKPEHLQWWLPGTPPRPSPLTAEEVTARLAAFAALSARVAKVEAALPDEKREAFFELVAYPVRGAALANERYFAGEQSALPGGDPALAERARSADAKLREETRRFNEQIAGGKWNRILALEPADNDWKSMRIAPWTLPTFTKTPADIGPAGGAPVRQGGGGAPLISDLRSQASDGPSANELAAYGVRTARAGAEKGAGATAVPPVGFSGFVEAAGVVSIEAVHASERVAKAGAAWEGVPGLGRGSDAVSVFPTTAPRIPLERATTDAPRLDYAVCFTSTGAFPVELYLLPTHPIDGGGELTLAMALDDGAPQSVTLSVDDGGRGWAEGVLASTRIARALLRVTTPGVHVLRIFGTDPGIMLEKLVIDCGGLQPSYLGPRETAHVAGNPTETRE